MKPDVTRKRFDSASVLIVEWDNKDHLYQWQYDDRTTEYRIFVGAGDNRFPAPSAWELV